MVVGTNHAARVLAGSVTGPTRLETESHCSIEKALYSTHQVTISGGVHAMHPVSNYQHSATLVFKCKIHLRYWRAMTVEP